MLLVYLVGNCLPMLIKSLNSFSLENEESNGRVVLFLVTEAMHALTKSFEKFEA